MWWKRLREKTCISEQHLAVAKFLQRFAASGSVKVCVAGGGWWRLVAADGGQHYHSDHVTVINRNKRLLWSQTELRTRFSNALHRFGPIRCMTGNFVAQLRLWCNSRGMMMLVLILVNNTTEKLERILVRSKKKTTNFKVTLIFFELLITAKWMSI